MAGIQLKTLAVITAVTTAGGTAISSSLLVGSVYLEADEGNSGKVYIGDVNVSATRYMAVLEIVASATAQGTKQKGILISSPAPLGPGASNLDLSSIYALGSAASQKLHVTYLERMGG